jgi:hypothetical protein
MSEPFDFEAFISGTQLARGTVSFYKADHRTEIAALQAEHDALPPEGGDDRMSSKSARRDVAKRIADLREQMEASKVEFIIRTLTPDEFKRIEDEDALDVYDQLEWQSVEPKLTKEQWRQLGARIGMAQFSAIVKDANALVLSKVAVPDFSRSVSETLSPPKSSES